MAKTPDEIKREMWKAIGGAGAKPGFTPMPVDSALDGSPGVAMPMGGVADISAIYDADDAGTPKATLGDWLAGETEKNAYGPSDGLSYGTLEVAGADIGSARIYGADMLQAAQDYFDLQSGGGSPDTREGGAFSTTALTDLGIDKTDGVSGHNLLSGVEGNDWDTSGTTNYGTSKSDITKSVVSNVLKNNRFTPTGDSPYIDNRDYSAGMYTTQNKFGRYDPNANNVTLEDVSRIGLGLILRQTGDTQDPKDGGQTKALVEGLLEQLAIKKIDTVNLQAGTIEGVSGRPDFSQTNQDPTGALIDQDGERTRGNGNNEPIEAKGRKSYGALNSWLEPFDGPLPTAMILLAAIAAIATLVAGVILGLLLDLIFFLFPPGDEPMGKAPKPMGASGGKPDYGDGNIGFRILQFMGIPNLYSGKGFTMCMIAGVLQFFLGHAFPRFLGPSAGYYVVVCRAAIRDIEQITRATENVNFKDLVGAIEGVFVMLEAFTTSTMFTFLCTMAKLGDVSWMSGGVWGKSPLTFAPTDNLPETDLPSLANLHTKSRMYTVPTQPETDYGQAMRLGNLPSHFILTNQSMILLGENQQGYPSSRNGLMLDDSEYVVYGNKLTKFRTTIDQNFIASNPARIDIGKQIDIERALDTMYMPFYFKDLRTGEIIALYAFVEGITDSYSPKWNATRGFGRTDPVQVYESTERKIGLSFWIVPMDEQDADEMYYIINKLVAMVYPQWSRGTQRVTADGKVKFIQPFSQVPTASPLVRMRLGDLFKSNYTPRGLKRQFGYGTKSFEMEVTDTAGTAGVSYQEVQANKLDKFENAEDMYLWAMSAAQLAPEPFEMAKMAIIAAQTPLSPGQPESGFGIGQIVMLKPGKYPYMKSATIDPLKPKTIFGFKTAMKRYKSDQERECVVIGYLVTPVGKAVTGEEGAEPDAGGKTKTHPEKFKCRYIVEPSANTVAAGGDIPEQYAGMKCAHDALTFSPANFKKFCDDEFGSPMTALEEAAVAAGLADPPPPEEYGLAEEVVKFFDPENNAVARSFKAGSGFGLACAITQLDFDWSNGETITWSTEHGRKAPSMCKVTMGFSPIHDLPLGLDADGGLANPAYPTGNIVQQIFGTDPWTSGTEAKAYKEKLKHWQDAEKTRAAAALAAEEETTADGGDLE